MVEPMNMTIMERTRSMRLHAGLLLYMWVKAVNIVVYFINRGSSTPLGCGILEEAWIGKKESYSFLEYLIVNHFHILILKIEPSWKLSQRYVYFLDMGLMNLVIGFGLLKILIL